jgi:hypothetical protein
MMKTCQDSWTVGKDFNQEPSEKEAEILPA